MRRSRYATRTGIQSGERSVGRAGISLTFILNSEATVPESKAFYESAWAIPINAEVLDEALW